MRRGKQEVSMFFLVFIVLLLAFSCGEKEKKCVTNADCPSGQVCIDGNCENPQACSSDSDCPAGYVCKNNICVLKEAECTTDSDCPTNYICQNGTCVPKDTTPPETTITSYPQNPTSSTSATFTFTCNEQNCTFECRIDGSGYSPCSSPKTFTNLSEGEHTFYVRAIDSAGNVDSTPASYTWKIVLPDTTPPETTITSYPQNPTSSTSATFEFNCNEQNCTFECRIDGGQWESCSSPKTYTNLSEGGHSFEVRAIDSAGNVETTPASYSWTIDTIPPETTIVSKPSDPSNSSDATFTFTCSEQNCTFECRIDGGQWESCSSPKTYTNLSEGEHTFYVRAKDSAGNVDPAPATYTWTIVKEICLSNGDAIRISNPQPIDGDVILPGNNTFRFTIEYNLKSQDSSEIYVDIADENWDYIDSVTRTVTRGCGVEYFEINVDVPAGTKLVYIETYLDSQTFIGDFLNYIVDINSDWISILSTDPAEGSLILPGNITISSRVAYNLSGAANDTLAYLIYDDQGNLLDWQSLSVSNGNGSIDFISDISVGCSSMLYIIAYFGSLSTIGDVSTFIVKQPDVPMLAVNPSSLSFVTGIGQNPPPQSISIDKCGPYDVSWYITDNANWLSEDPSSGTTPSSVTVSVDSAGLQPGTYNGIITISSSQASNSPVTVPVTLDVYNIQVQWVTPPPNQMESGVDYTVEYSISGEYSGCWWIQYGTDPDPINNPQSYTQWQCGGPGTYQDTLNVISCTGETYYFVVAAWVNGYLFYSNIVSSGVNPPSGYLLRVEPSSLWFYAVAGGDNPPPQSLWINEACGNSIDWNASDDADWLSVIPSSGNTPSSTDVSVDITGLPRGTYEGIITISSPQASNSPVTVPVTLDVYNIQVQWVTPPPPVMDSCTPYQVTYSISGSPSGGAGRIQYGTDPDPRINYSYATNWQWGWDGEYTETIIVSTPVTQTYYFVVNWDDFGVNTSLYSDIVASVVNPVSVPQYSISFPVYAWDPSADPPNGSLAIGNGSDDESYALSLPFPFNFYGTDYNTVYIDSNGRLNFYSNTSYYSNLPFPCIEDKCQLVIAPFWDDLTTSPSGSEVRYAIVGAAPERRVVITWTRVEHLGDGDTNTFQVILYEGTNEIKFQYQTINPYGEETVGLNLGDGCRHNSYPSSSLGNGTAILFSPP